MPISSLFKKIHANWTDTPLAGFLRESDHTQKLDVAISESVTIQTYPEDTLYMSEFAEQRVAAPGNRADVEFLYDKQPLLFDDISANAGSVIHQANPRDLLLAIGGVGATDVAGMRLHYWTPYTPGSGQEEELTGVMDNAGLGGTAMVFLRSTISGSTTLQTINQANWQALNLPENLDWTKSHIFRMSFQSLRVGRIQFSIIQAGVPVKVAEIVNDNIRNSGYWQYANLPLYWKLFNTDANTIMEIGYGDDYNGIGFRYVMPLNANATARAICGTVKSQGGDGLFDIPGYEFSISNYLTPKTVSATLIPVLSIQVAATFNSIVNRMLMIPKSFSLDTDNPIYYAIYYRPTLTGAAFGAVDATYSGMNFDVTASAITGGIKVYEDYLTSGVANREALFTGVLGRVIMALGNTGTSDILSIAAIRSGGTNAAVYSTLKWKELR